VGKDGKDVGGKERKVEGKGKGKGEKNDKKSQ
jgi:hypothetical protein